MNPVLQIFGILLSAAAALIGVLVLWNLKMLVKRLDAQEIRINKIEARQETINLRKETCQQEFVSGELFLRETGFQRRAIENLSASMNRLEGNLKVIEKLPEISGEIARKIVHEFKNGENK